jgi:hypothetical protein
MRQTATQMPVKPLPAVERVSELSPPRGAFVGWIDLVVDVPDPAGQVLRTTA